MSSGLAAAVLLTGFIVPRVSAGTGAGPVARGSSAPRPTPPRTADVGATHPGATTSPCTFPTQHPGGSAPRPTPTTNPGSPTSTRPRSGSPDEIAFASDRSGDWEIYSMALDGTRVRRVTHSAGIDREPDWSPDGKQLVFVKLPSQQSYAGDVYIVNA